MDNRAALRVEVTPDRLAEIKERAGGLKGLRFVKPDGSLGVSTSIFERELARDVLALLSIVEELQREVERLKTRGGIAVSLLPAIRLAKFHERCEQMGLNPVAACTAENTPMKEEEQ